MQPTTETETSYKLQTEMKATCVKERRNTVYIRVYLPLHFNSWESGQISGTIQNHRLEGTSAGHLVH